MRAEVPGEGVASVSDESSWPLDNRLIFGGVWRKADVGEAVDMME